MFQEAGFAGAAERLMNKWVGGSAGADLYLAAQTELNRVQPSVPAAKTTTTTFGDEPTSGGAIQAQMPDGRIITAPAASLRDIIKAGGRFLGNIVTGNPVGGIIGLGADILGGIGGIAGGSPAAGGVVPPNLGQQVSDMLGGLDLGGSAQLPFGDEAVQTGPIYVDTPNGTEVATSNAVVTKPMTAPRLKAPRGSVIVTVYPGQPYYSEARQLGKPVENGGYKVAINKKVARGCGLYKTPVKPLLTSSERKTIRRAETLKRQVAKTAKAAGISCTVPRRRR